MVSVKVVEPLLAAPDAAVGSRLRRLWRARDMMHSNDAWRPSSRDNRSTPKVTWVIGSTGSVPAW